MVPPALSESGFYSRYFLAPKKDGGLRPILDLRRLNHALMRRPFRMITLKQILSQIRTGNWFCSLDLKDAYFHIQMWILEIRLRQMGIRILNYLDDWLILSQSEVELLSHRTLILSHLERLGLRVNFAKSALSPSQRVSFLGTVLDSAHMRAVIAPERALAIQKLAATFKSDTRSPTQSVSENAGPMAAASPVFTAGPAPHAPPSRWLKPRVPHNAWRHGRLHIRVNQACVTALTPWKKPTVDEEERGHGVGPHQESCHDRRLQHRLGGKGKPTFGHWSKAESGFHINCLEMLAVCRACQFFPARPNRTPCADSLRQHVRGVLYKSPGKCLLEAPLYSGRAPSGMGSAQPALTEGSTPAGQTEPRSGYVISAQCPLRGVDAPSAGGSEDLEDLWQGRRSRPFRLQRQLSLPNLLFEGQGRVGPQLAQPPPLCIPPLASGVSRNRVTRCYWWPPCGGTNLGCQS